MHNNNDDIADDAEFDVTDLGDDTDLADESWDEFDDGDDKADAPAALPKKSTGKGFVSKYFNIIVAAVVLGGGGAYFFMGSGSAPDTSLQADQTGATPVELAEDSNPPMPAPLDSSAEPTDISEGGATPAPTPEALTPLPGAQNPELADLGAPNASPAPVETVETATIQAEPMLEITPPSEAPPEEVPLEPTPVADAGILSPEPPPPAVMADVPAPAQSNSEDQAKIQEMQATIDSLNEQLKQKTATADKKIESLELEIGALEEKLENAAAKAESKSAPAEEPATISTIDKLETKPAKKAAPKKAASKPAEKPAAEKAPARTTQWVMRSAQPGRASVSNTKTSDMRDVVVGDTLDGVGRITSIGLENGVWTVRGTKGFIIR